MHPTLLHNPAAICHSARFGLNTASLLLVTSSRIVIMKMVAFLLSSLSMEATQPRSLTSPGTPMSPGSSAQCLKTTLCKSGKW